MRSKILAEVQSILVKHEKIERMWWNLGAGKGVALI